MRARPKAVVEDDAGLWIAKFNTATDPWNNARVEHAMLLLARACDLGTAESRVIDVAGRDVLLVKRFDREKKEAGYRRARRISARSRFFEPRTPINRATAGLMSRWWRSCAASASRRKPMRMNSSEEHRDLAMECGDLGRFANADNLLSQSAGIGAPFPIVYSRKKRSALIASDP